MFQFMRQNARWLGAGFLLAMFSSFGQTFFIGLSGLQFQERFGLSGGEFGLLYMVATLASALTLPWLGRTVDTMQGHRVAKLVMPGLAGACLLAAWSPHILGLLVAIYLLRLLGQGMMTHIAQTEIARSFSANRGRAISLITPGHQAGEAALPIAFVALSALVGWQWSWTAAAALIVLVGMPIIINLLSVPRAPQGTESSDRNPHQGRDWTRAEVVREPSFYILLTGVLAPAFISTSIFFHQGHLIALRGYDPLVFAGAFPVMAITTATFGLISGYLIDRFGAAKMLPFMLLPLFIASLAVAQITVIWGIYVFMFLLGISYGMTSTLFGALWPELYGVAHIGSVRSLIFATLVVATAVGPGLTGALIDRGITLPEQLWWMALWCVLASVALAIAARRIERLRRIDNRTLSP